MANNINVTEVADKLVEANEVLTTTVEDNQGSSYKAIRAIVDINVYAISQTFADGKFISNQDKHSLTWAIINRVEGKDSTPTLSMGV